ncbi:MAG TPA: trigger factor [Beijerinckiaceae bacterium]
MQVTETLSEGLRREFRIVLPAAELDERLTNELSTLKDKVRLNGFRPGKVPLAHLRKVYGKSVMTDVIQNAIMEVEKQIVDERGLRLANPPQRELPEDKDEIAKILEAKGDLAFKLAVEVLPSFELADLSDVTVKKPVAAVTDADLDEALSRMAAQNRPFSDKGEGAEAAAGDRVVVDFVGRIDGQEFQGGKGEGIQVELGAGQFIPGFEDQLLGAKAGEGREVKVTFPPNYGAEHLAGKDAVFDVTVKEVQAPGEVAIDDDLAKGFGMESLDKLKEAVRGAIQRDHDTVSRRKLKKELLDALDTKYTFELPQGLVEQEFAAVWSQVEADLKNNNKSFADEGTTEEAARADYRRIAERRVRLGLVLAQVGDKADIKVSDDEVNQALVERVRQYPGQEKQVWDYYQKNPQARAEIRAPLFEEKVVDHVLAQVRVVEEPVSKEKLFGDDEDEAQKPAAA